MGFDQLPIELLHKIFYYIIHSSPPFLQLRLLCRRVDSILVGHLLEEAGFYTGSIKWRLRREPLNRSRIEMTARLMRERLIRVKSNNMHSTGVTDQIFQLVDGIAELPALKPHISDVDAFKTKYRLALAYTVVSSLGTGADEWECPASRGFETVHPWGTRLSCFKCLQARGMPTKMPPTGAALVAAASAGSVPDMEVLLDAGADVNFEAGKLFGRPLHVAAFAGHEEAVRWLLEHGADPNLPAFKGYTALQLAAVADRASIVQLLLDKGADPNKRDERGRTPLLYATIAGNSSVTKILIAWKDTDPNLRDGENYTPALVEAVFGDHEDIVRQLVEREDVDMDPFGGSSHKTPIFGPVFNENESMLKLLLSRPDVDINTYNDLDLTPLADAIVAGDENLAKLFLTREDLEIEMGYRGRGSDFIQGDCPALALACYVGLTEVVRAILERGNVDVNRYAPELPEMLVGDEPLEHATPLTLAVLGRHKKIVALLLEHPKIKPDLEDYYGRTPLVTAVIRGHVQIVKMLLKHPDVDINTTDLLRRTALLEAVSGGHDAIVKILCESEHLELDFEDSTGETALMVAAKMGNGGMVQTMLNNNYIDAHHENSDGTTALTIAAEAGHIYIVQMLLKYPEYRDEGPKKRHVMDALLGATMFEHFDVALVLRDYMNSLPEGTFEGESDEHESVEHELVEHEFAEHDFDEYDSDELESDEDETEPGFELESVSSGPDMELD